MRNKWYEFVTQNRLNVSDINKYSLLCSKHFDSSHFITHENSRRLQKTAVPNVIITRVKYVSPLLIYIAIFNKMKPTFYML